MNLSKVILGFELEDIEGAGYDTANITEEQFNQIYNRLCKHYDNDWFGVVADACEDILPKKEE